MWIHGVDNFVVISDISTTMSIAIIQNSFITQNYTNQLFLVNEDFQASVNKNIMFTSCDQTNDLMLTIIDDRVFEKDENIVITLINVTLTRMENGSNVILNLTEEERSRLVWSMAEATITIADDDGKLS